MEKVMVVVDFGSFEAEDFCGELTEVIGKLQSVKQRAKEQGFFKVTISQEYNLLEESVSYPVSAFRYETDEEAKARIEKEARNKRAL